MMENKAGPADSSAKSSDGAKPVDGSSPLTSSSSSSPLAPSSSVTSNKSASAATSPKKRKESLPALAQALPHPAELRPIKAAAVSKSLLKFRKERLRDAAVAKKVLRRFPVLNKFWAELVVDLDDDGTRCDVCGNYDTLPDDQILLCDGCDVAVHQTCYNVKEVPEGEWFCRYCHDERRATSNVQHLRRLAFKTVSKTTDKNVLKSTLQEEIDRMEREKEPFCILPKACPLCPRRFGAHIRSSEGSQIWVHVNCAVWLPEGWVTGVEDAGGLLQAASWRFEKICDLCGVDEGAVVKCHQENCPAVFHPVCATMAAYGMNLTGQLHVNRRHDMTFHAFCLRHRGYAFRESVDVEEPLEYLRRHPDFTHPFLRAANLIRRNRDILFYVNQCHKDETTWGLRMGAYLTREFNENLVAIRAFWMRVSDLCAPERPLSTPSGGPAPTVTSGVGKTPRPAVVGGQTGSPGVRTPSAKESRPSTGATAVSRRLSTTDTSQSTKSGTAPRNPWGDGDPPGSVVNSEAVTKAPLNVSAKNNTSSPGRPSIGSTGGDHQEPEGGNKARLDAKQNPEERRGSTGEVHVGGGREDGKESTAGDAEAGGNPETAEPAQSALSPKSG
ncbi:phd-finger domain-containing protein [Cystoisospora suis]|uniref:Phd-finger domain-containing protein n=1 Tax=Cystoisospora suis TaxID=483139 RepID=A0A2C6K2U6_9APIC|nr:phd-finger domain-containing protein [Cystoisospora suis]